MMIFVGVSVFILGTIIGSFLNVLLLRHGTRRSLGGRSGCMMCRTRLSWWQLFPVGSFLVLRGRCNLCRGRISAQYPIVEIMTGFVFVTTFMMSLSFLQSLLMVGILTLTVLIFVYDFRHMIIPNSFVYPFIVLSIVWVALSTPEMVWWAIFSGPISAVPIFLLWFFSRGRAMGFGDVKLMLGIGWFLGVLGGMAVLYIAFVLGAVVGLFVIFVYPYVIHVHRRLQRRVVVIQNRVTTKNIAHRQIPFGPFLIIGFWAVLVFGIDITFFLFL